MKKKFNLSFSEDVSEFITNYSKEKKLSLSVAAERILLKGIEVMESKNNNDLLNEISKLIGNGGLNNSPAFQEEIEVENEEENSGDLDLNNEDDSAIWDMFNNV